MDIAIKNFPECCKLLCNTLQPKFCSRIANGSSLPPRDRKYPNGVRPNRTAGCGYWKATGTDKPILNSRELQCIGIKKALVFYKGRPPKDIKTDWVMHEYRLLDDNDTVLRIRGSMRLDDWVLYRIRKKNNTPKQNGEDVEDQSTLSYIPQLSNLLSCRTEILKNNRSMASPNEIREYDPDFSKNIRGIDEQTKNYSFNMRGLSNPSSNTDTMSYHSYDKMSSPMEDVFKSLKRADSVVSFGEEFHLSPNKKIHPLSQENMNDSSIFQTCYLPNFTSPDTYSDPSP